MRREAGWMERGLSLRGLRRDLREIDVHSQRSELGSDAPSETPTGEIA